MRAPARLCRLTAGFVLATAAVAGPVAADCSPRDWRGCEGRPWVIGKTETPLGEKWWPHPRWGGDDEAGSTNWYTKPEVLRRATAEADRGRVYRLGRPYSAGMPMFGDRTFDLRMPGHPTGGPFGANRMTYNDEFLATEIGQVGTQFDGVGHIGVAFGSDADRGRIHYYNGFTDGEIASPTGLKRLGVEKLHPIVARGVLLDVAGLKGVDALEAGQEITLADVKAALARQGMAGFAFAPGDGVFFRTGWGRHWSDPTRYNEGAPGIGMEVARWLSDQVEAGVVGADTWPTEVVPNPDDACVFCVHTHLITRHGIVNQENMDLDALARDRVYTFLYVYSPVPIVGATGSIGAPLAID